MTAGVTATWKVQFMDEANTWPAPANPNNKLGTYATLRKHLIKAFSMFDSVGDVLNELQALRMKKNDSINKHIAKFKMLAAESKIDMTNPLVIELFKETLPWGLTVQLMRLETPLKTINDWYKWAVSLNHQHHKLNWATKQMRENMAKEKNSTKRYYFLHREKDPNAMDVVRLSIDEQARLMKEGRCFKCKNTGHWANECPDDKKKYKEELKKKEMNGRELHAHIWALFKDMTEEDRKEFWKVLKKWVFKKESYLNISISLPWHLLSSNSKYFTQFNLCSYQYLLKWTNH
jgi:hypothetical protein